MNGHIIEIRVWGTVDIDHFMLLEVQKNCMNYNNSSSHDLNKIKCCGGALSGYIPGLVYYTLLFCQLDFYLSNRKFSLC